MKLALLFVLGMILVFFGMYMEISIWNECRLDNSWAYCMRVLGSKT